jgi:parvulin-like peptidyl-prolyl isomerase
MIKQHKILFDGKKVLFALLVSATFSCASIINGIALTVNDEPITLMDIKKKEIEGHMKRDQAVSELIDQVLFNQLVKKNNITADIFDVNNYLEKVAASNGMDLYTFKSIIRQKYDYKKYEENTKNLIIRQKLTRTLVRGNIKIATDEDLKIYYENNKNMFRAASKINAIQYVSKSKEDLKTVLANPMANLSSVSIAPISLNQSNLNSQLRYIINETKINSFTPIFASDKQYVSLLIKKKEGVQTINFDDVKDRIFNILMQDREKKYLKDYFEKQKISADIRVVR